MAKAKKEPRVELDPLTILKRDLKGTALWISLSVGVVVVLASVHKYLF